MKYILVIVFFFQILSLSAFAQQYKYHTVKKGETVYSIAKDNNISKEQIYKYNPDAKNGIEVSSKLVIPTGTTNKSGNTIAVKDEEEGEVSFTTHVVKKKETLFGLSQEYNVEIDEIKRYNKQLYAKELQIGEEIRIPVRSQVSSTNKEIKEQHSASTNTIAGTGENPAQQISKTREHIVLPKETKFGIARKYGLTVKELEALNPKVEVLQPGVMLRVGTKVLDEPVVLLDDQFIFYEVKPKENLFRLSQRFNVSQDSLISLNPALQDGLKYGMVLKVPNKTGEEGQMLSDQEFQTTDVEVDDTSENMKLDLQDKISNLKAKQLVLMLPYHLEKLDTSNTPKDAILDDRALRISLDFQEGVLLAIEKAKEWGISTNLKVYDTQRNISKINTIIATHNFQDVDAVIGPLYQNTTEAAASKLATYNIPVFSPLSNRSMKAMNNLFQSRPTDEMLTNSMLDYLSAHASEKNNIIIADAASYNIKSKLSGVLPSAKTITPVDGYVASSKIKAVLSKNSENWVTLESTNIGVVNSVTSALNRLSKEYKITLLTTDKNDTYENDNVSNEHLGALNFHYPSVDKEYDEGDSKEFFEKYKEKNAVTPNQYTIRGYDLTLDILLRLASTENLYDSFQKFKGYTEYNENKFHYLPLMGGGYHNDAVYIMQIDKDLNLSVAK